MLSGPLRTVIASRLTETLIRRVDIAQRLKSPMNGDNAACCFRHQAPIAFGRIKQPLRSCSAAKSHDNIC